MRKTLSALDSGRAYVGWALDPDTMFITHGLCCIRFRDNQWVLLHDRKLHHGMVDLEWESPHGDSDGCPQPQNYYECSGLTP